MDANLKYDPNQQQQLVVYRQLRIRDDVLPEEARVLTDAFVNHDIRLVNQDWKREYKWSYFKARSVRITNDFFRKAAVNSTC